MAVTRLPGYGPGERLAAAARVAGGRLLTAGYVGGGGASSLRLWQAEPQMGFLAAAIGDPDKPALPAEGEPLCLRLGRGLPLAQGLSRPSALDWQAGDRLLVTNDDGSVAQWTLGGSAAPLPPDDTRMQAAFAPGYTRLLRYGSAEGGEIWRWTGEEWVQEGAVAGSITAAMWSAHGLLVQLEDGSGVLLDPDSGERRSLPEGVQLEGSTLVTPDLLVALRGANVELWQIGGSGPLSSWPVPDGRLLQLIDAAPDSGLLLYQDPWGGQLYVLRFEPAAQTLAEVWRSDEFHVNPGPARLSPSLPLLATINDGALALVNLEGGGALWSSRSVAPVAAQEFQAVQWSTDGQYLITQAQQPQVSSVEKSIGVWRSDGQTGAPVLLQEVQAADLVGVRPDMRWLLVSEPRPLSGKRVVAWPIFTDTAQLQQEIADSCLLVRPLSAAQRQAFLINGS